VAVHGCRWTQAASGAAGRANVGLCPASSLFGQQRTNQHLTGNDSMQTMYIDKNEPGRDNVMKAGHYPVPDRYIDTVPHTMRPVSIDFQQRAGE